MKKIMELNYMGIISSADSCWTRGLSIPGSKERKGLERENWSQSQRKIKDQAKQEKKFAALLRKEQLQKSM